MAADPITARAPQVTTGTPTSDTRALEAGLDALDAVVAPSRPAWWRTTWSAAWPTALALVVLGGAWQAVVAAKVKPTYALPSPIDV
jgi:NitT/TauT family transport system permease protein